MGLKRVKKKMISYQLLRPTLHKERYVGQGILSAL